MRDYARFIPEYMELRDLGRQLNSQLVSTLKKDELEEGARKLGILKGGTMVFGSEDETSC